MLTQGALAAFWPAVLSPVKPQHGQWELDGLPVTWQWPRHRELGVFTLCGGCTQWAWQQ